MVFNRLAEKLLKEAEAKILLNNKNAQRSRKNMHQNPTFNQPLSPSAYSGFKGDTLNPSMNTVVFKQPRVKKSRKP